MNSGNQNCSGPEPGLGCVTFGREIDARTSFDLMDHALSSGIVSFDTAAAYGSGASEETIGRWIKLRGMVDGKVRISTKILPPYDAASIREAVNQSLGRLQLAAIDVLYLHRWDELLNVPEAWQQLDRLRKQGKIKQLGASNFTAGQMRTALQLQKENGIQPLEFVQNNHNLAVSDLNDEMRQLCTEHAIDIITYSPLGAGFLTGKHLNSIEKGSRFDVMPAHQQIYFVPQAKKRLEKLLQVASRTGFSATQLALAWAFHQPGISAVLIGGRCVAHIDQALEAARFYAKDLFAELEAV